MKLVVTGVTRTGNLGGTAMLCAVEGVVDQKVDDFVLASILPARDLAQTGPDNARIAPADYRLWLLVIAPLCLLLWPIRRIGFVRSLMQRLPICDEFANADAVADLSGIAFVDGRGLALLWYNTALALPALFFDVPIHKLSQALGPFNTWINRYAAGFILKRCQTVAARGPQSLAFLHGIGISKAIFRPDTSFAMDVSEAHRQSARAECIAKIATFGERPLVIVTPSAVVDNYCKKNGIDFPGVMAHTMLALHYDGIDVAFLAHSSDTGISKNDDLAIIDAIRKKLGQEADKMPVFHANNDPRLARAIIAQSDVFVASRFHSLIGALSQAVPVVTIGWSHKYKEAAQPFGMAPHVMDFSKLKQDYFANEIRTLLDNRKALHEQMVPVAEKLAKDAASGVEVVLDWNLQ